MSDKAPIIVWFRRDLRLSDHLALSTACASGRPVIPVFVHDQSVETLGAAPRFRLGLSLASLANNLKGRGSRLILRKGDAQQCLFDLIAETGAKAVYWTRLYDPVSRQRDETVKSTLRNRGIQAQSFSGHTVFEPWDVQTGQGGFYRVFTPFWRNLSRHNPVAPIAAPTIPQPDTWPDSADLPDWHMAGAMQRGADIVAPYCCVGEGAAQNRLHQFIEERIASYEAQRDFPASPATSGLSENLTYGEISARQCWYAGWAAMQQGASGATCFLKELAWREYAWHLLYHTPHMARSCWRPEWDHFPWNRAQTPDMTAWQQARTGIPLVDAGLREMYVTGTMHNRVRMIVASYLTKHLLTHWQIGMDWFADCLIDWDPASNAMGWQWVAGCGPDASPYFRIFNPVTQQKKFDPDGIYLRKWLAHWQAQPEKSALAYFDAIPRSWALSPTDPYPTPVVPLDVGRKRALAAYEAR